MFKSTVLLIAGVTLFTFHCATREPIAIIKDYEAAFNDSLNMTYYYSRQPQNDTLVVQFENNIFNNVRFVTESEFTSKRMEGTRKFRITAEKKEIIEATSYFDFDSMLVLNPTIVTHKLLSGDRYPGGLYHYRYTYPNNVISNIVFEEIFAKDTVYTFDGKTYPTLKFDEEISMELHPWYKPFFQPERKVHGAVLFAKGVGIVEMTLDDKEFPFTQKLLRVEKKRWQQNAD
jgi:hypothetical protein